MKPEKYGKIMNYLDLELSKALEGLLLFPQF